MVKRLTDSPVVMGSVLPVENTEKRFGESDRYYAVKVEQMDGTKEEWLMLTEAELKRCVLDIGDIAGMMKPGRIYPHNVGNKKSWMVRLLSEKNSKVVLIGTSIITVARRRASRNPEDVPRQSRLLDFLD